MSFSQFRYICQWTGSQYARKCSSVPAPTISASRQLFSQTRWSREATTLTRPRSSRSTDNSSTFSLVLYVTTVAAVGIWGIQKASTIHNDAPPLPLPQQLLEQNIETDELIVWKGMVHPALDMAAANTKLRAEQTSTRFITKHATGATRADSIRVASNSPSEDERSYSVAYVGEPEAWKFWGVYDGHAGWATARLLRSYLALYVAQALRQARNQSSTFAPGLIDNAIKTGFLNLDNEIISDGLRALTDSKTHAEALSRIAPARAGSCALLAVFDPANSVLRVACTGDSRAVLGRLTPTTAETSQNKTTNYVAEPLSVDQTGFNESEVKRISQSHPDEPEAIDKTSGRLLGLAVTRAFGDHRWKWPLDAITKCNYNFYGTSARPKYVSPPYLTAEPEVTTTRVNKGDFLILASDGLWDHMSSEHAVECVSRWIQKEQSSDSTIEETQHASEPSVQSLNKGLNESKFSYWYKGTPEHFVVEDNNVATHLVRNALGGSRRELFCSVMSMSAPDSRNVRDDITVQVVFFGDVLGAAET